MAVYVSRTRGGRTLVSGYCTCLVAADCKHVAATLIAALGKPATPPAALPALGLVAQAPVVPKSRATSLGAREPKAIVTDPRVDLWLNEIRASASVTFSAAVPGDERVAYVLVRAKPMSRSFAIDLFVTRLTKTQQWVEIRETNADALVNASAPAIAPEDTVIGRFLQIYERTYRGRAPLANDLVPRIVATGRAHFEQLDTSPLTLGPSRSARIEWILAPDGSQRPSLSFEDSQTIALPGAAPWYVDPQALIAADRGRFLASNARRITRRTGARSRASEARA